LRLNVLPKVPHNRINEYYWSADIVIGSIGAGVLGMVALEAIACRRPVITYVSSRYLEYKNFPLKDIDSEEKIIDAINMAADKLWMKEYEYLKKNHDPKMVIRKP